MRFRMLVPLATLAGLAAAVAQSRPDCPMRPTTLASMRTCYRPLLVFAPSANDPRVAAQRVALDSAADDMMDRNVLLVAITAGPNHAQAPLDAPYSILPAPEMAALRKQYGVAPGTFKVLLLGEDGGVKLHSSTPVTVERLNRLIDTMPTRKLEMQRPHMN